jgi:GNAT superfamily N-acetyltransferase
MAARVASPDTPVRVRPMAAHEAGRVGEVVLAAYDAYGDLRGPYRDLLADPVARRDGCSALLVAEVDGDVVGTVTYVRPGDEQWEDRPVPTGDAGFRVLAVDPRAEGRGIGRTLVEACIDRARREGRRRLVVTSMHWMTRAHRLYERLGFVRRHDLDVRFPSGVGWTLTYDLTDDAPAHFAAPGPVPEQAPWFEDVWGR